MGINSKLKFLIWSTYFFDHSDKNEQNEFFFHTIFFGIIIYCSLQHFGLIMSLCFHLRSSSQFLPDNHIFKVGIY